MRGELKSQRAVWIDSDGFDNSFFRVCLTGGEWLLKHTGKPYDKFKALARGEKPKKFASHYIGQYSAGFSIELFTMHGAKTLAEEFCHKMTFFYYIFLDHESDFNYKFSTTDIESYRELLEFESYINGKTGEVLERCLWVRSLMK